MPYGIVSNSRHFGNARYPLELSISQDLAARQCAPLEPRSRYGPHGQLSTLAFNSEIISYALKWQVDRLGKC